jgi:hypothetical protein
MFDLTYRSLANPRPELAPARALLTPTWIAALAVLVANDHWLKGSGLAPGLLTGKLSDFAGMLVAPVLLASLLGLRSRRGLALCHAAVALVFTGIQLSPAFAGQWSALMGLFGHPWVITCDPTDLIALPFLGLSWALLVPEMDPSKPALAPLQRTAVATLSVFGLWSTVATSDDSGMAFDDEWYVDVTGNIYVNNANDFQISLHVRGLRDLDLDCDQISLDPGRLLTDAAFGPAEHWSLPARTNVGIELFGPAGCGAALIAGEGIPTTIVFVEDNRYPIQWFPGQTFATDELDYGGTAIVFGESGSEWFGGDEFRFAPRTAAPELPAECAAPEAEARLDWSGEVPARPVELLGLEHGVDGCHEFLVQELGWITEEIVPQGSPYSFYVCGPELVAEFEPGARIQLQQSWGHNGDRVLSLTLLDPETLTEAVDPFGTHERRVRLLRGANDPQLIGPMLGRTVVAVPAYSCPWLIEDGCATVERPTALANHDLGELAVGVPVVFTDLAAPVQRTAVLSYARERALVDPGCIDGAERLRFDLDLVIVEQPKP